MKRKYYFTDPEGFLASILYLTPEEAMAMPHITSVRPPDRPSADDPDPTLDDWKAVKWSKIKSARDASEHGGFDTSWGRFDSDPASQTKLIGAAQLASIALAQGAPFGIEWTLQDNTSVPLDANQMISVGVALAAHIDAAHQRGRQLRAQIEAATTLQDLEAITWDAT